MKYKEHLDPFSFDERTDQEIKKIKDQIKDYKWINSIEIAKGISTSGRNDNRDFILNQFNLVNFNNKKVLDIGCADCLYSFEAEIRGAKEITAIDSNVSKGAVEILIPLFNSKTKIKEIDFFDFKTKEKFDVIIFSGILFHLKYPILALEMVSNLLKKDGKLIESAMFSDQNEKALLYCPNLEESHYKGEYSNSNTFFNHKGLIDKLGSFGVNLTNIYPDKRGFNEGGINRDSFLFEKK